MPLHLQKEKRRNPIRGIEEKDQDVRTSSDSLLLGWCIVFAPPSPPSRPALLPHWKLTCKIVAPCSLIVGLLFEFRPWEVIVENERLEIIEPIFIS